MEKESANSKLAVGVKIKCVCLCVSGFATVQLGGTNMFL